MKAFLGVDVGSVRTKFALLDENKRVLHTDFVRTHADPMNALKEGMKNIFSNGYTESDIMGVGVTGSARELAAMILNADIVKNEISTHALAVSTHHPDVRTVIEIGGQDSKIILMEKGLIRDFAMNSVCAAGTGSFLEQQASRLGMSLTDLSELAMKATKKVAIAARCTVFAESDMIYKQQLGYAKQDIIYGLCLSLAKNYLNTLAKGKNIVPPICFQGGVAANKGMRKAFSELLAKDLIIPQHFISMGAIGAALFAIDDKEAYGDTRFSLSFFADTFHLEPFMCDECENRCNIFKCLKSETVIGYKGDICGKYSLGLED